MIYAGKVVQTIGGDGGLWFAEIIFVNEGDGSEGEAEAEGARNYFLQKVGRQVWQRFGAMYAIDSANEYANLWARSRILAHVEAASRKSKLSPRKSPQIFLAKNKIRILVLLCRL